MWPELLHCSSGLWSLSRALQPHWWKGAVKGALFTLPGLPEPLPPLQLLT